MGDKRGVMFFTVDALMAGVIFTFTVVLLLSFLLKVPISTDAKYYLDGYVDYVTTTKMSQYRVTSRIYYDQNERNPNMLVYQKILLMKGRGYSNETIYSFLDNISGFILPRHIGVEYKLDDEIIYSRHADTIDGASIYLTTDLLTFVIDENNVMYGPNITTVTVWV